MQPTEWDKTIKKLLDKRTVQPSENAWEKLSVQLSEKGIKRSNNYHLYGVAAGIACMIFLSALYFGTYVPEDRQLPASGPVQMPDSKIMPRELVAQPGEQSSASSVTATETVYGDQSTSAPENLPPIEATPLADTLDFGNPDEQSLAALPSEEALIQNKIDEVVAQVSAREKEEGELADSEVEELLRAAQQEILLSQNTRSGQSVDAMVLLSEVETELNRSFRDQIFEKLKAGYLKVRTAVADRNN